jgi:hypothetical protein
MIETISKPVEAGANLSRRIPAPPPNVERHHARFPHVLKVIGQKLWVSGQTRKPWEMGHPSLELAPHLPESPVASRNPDSHREEQGQPTAKFVWPRCFTGSPVRGKRLVGEIRRAVCLCEDDSSFASFEHTLNDSVKPNPFASTIAFERQNYV